MTLQRGNSMSLVQHLRAKHFLILVVISGFVLPILEQAPVLGQDDGFGPPPPPAVVGPKIVIPDPKFHWGKVLQGDKVEHTWIVRNEGSSVLRITQVKPG